MLGRLTASYRNPQFNTMNLLILSPGRRVEIVEYFKNEFHKDNRQVFTLDMSLMAPALYSGDKYFIVKKDFNNLQTYISDIINIALDNNVTSILSLIDPELVLLAENRELFLREGITPIVSRSQFICATFNKFEFYNLYKNLIPLVPTYSEYNDIINRLKNKELSYPIFAKLRNGSASIGIKKIESSNDFESIKGNLDYIYQPYIDGIEYGVDAYFDMLTGELVSVFIKRKITMRAGETDKAVSVKSDLILDVIKQISKINGVYGPIDIDIFVDKNNTVYINEINPRFGGGHPHAHGCGVNFMALILNNLKGFSNIPSFNDYEDNILMLKYNGILLRKYE